VDRKIDQLESEAAANGLAVSMLLPPAKRGLGQWLGPVHALSHPPNALGHAQRSALFTGFASQSAP
jgi:hypothetical protein